MMRDWKPALQVSRDQVLLLVRRHAELLEVQAQPAAEREKSRKEKRKPLPLVKLRAAPVMQDSAFEFEVRGGHRVRVHAGFDPDVLKRLLSVLESA